ncbi:MAG: hypothetical protein IPM34_02940 [Saprospiraceae bacterium]|nr:hypothetical protein [Saprospiraceae bacterium]
MEDWELDFEWLRIRHFVRDRLGSKSLPDLNAILLLIGIQELGRLKPGKFTKEEKTDLMHIASCKLLSEDGYYALKGLDQDGWPHFESLKPFLIKGVSAQERYLKEKAVSFFKLQYAAELSVELNAPIDELKP